MLKNLFLLFFISLTCQTYGQKKIKDFVQKNINAIRTIEPDSLDFSDLEVFGKAIGDSRIVMLGEQDHGDAPTFLAKTRLIKYLHEKKGFNVLAFESDFFALNEGWDNLEKKNDIINSFLKTNIWGVWTYCKQCENLLYNYIPNSFKNNPIKISGFDNQIHGTYSQKNLKKIVHNFIEDQKIEFTNAQNYQTDFLDYVDSVLVGNDVQKHKIFGNAIAIIIEQLGSKDSTTLEMMMIKNLKSCNNMTISRLLKLKDISEIRDKQMAENLKWLVNNKYKNEKIIVWAHNGHILKNPEQIKNMDLLKTMGNFFVQDSLLSKQTYILGFNSREGTAGRISIQNKFKVQHPFKNSFESWIDSKIAYGFIDFNKFITENPNFSDYFYMKGFAHGANSAVWTNVFDGVFYIRDMYPCEKIK